MLDRYVIPRFGETTSFHTMQYLVESLYGYNDWANAKIISLCSGLSDEELDQPREMGFGTLRSTLYHILSADVIWMERWQNVAWRPFPRDPEGMSVSSIADGLREVAARRFELLETHRDERWSHYIDYQDSKKTPYHHRLLDLLLHVFQHGVHHRAQALSYLKSFGRTVPGGIDYIFYRLATGPTKQSPEAIEKMTQYGLGVNETIGSDVSWEPSIVERLFEYSDWATSNVIANAQKLDDASLDRPIDMGSGSIRKNLLHMFDAEQWWTKNWTVGENRFPQTPVTTTIDELSERWKSIVLTRNEYLASISSEEAQRELVVQIGGPPTRFKVGDSAIQLTMHGTHHRAQVVNMFRQVGSPMGNIDLLYALAELKTH